MKFYITEFQYEEDEVLLISSTGNEIAFVSERIPEPGDFVYDERDNDEKIEGEIIEVQSSPSETFEGMFNVYLKVILL